MIKIVTVVGTRPEIIKMSRLIEKFDSAFNHKLIHTGQNYDYELNKVFFKNLNLRKPDFFLKSKSPTAIGVVSKIISSIEKILIKEKPDAFIIYGDTNSCLSAYVAKRLKIPVFHFEAGNRCFDENVPEEINRRLIDHISDVNFVISDHAKNYLLKEGIQQNYVIKTGSHMKEVLDYNKNKINESNILSRLKIKKEDYFVASIHREENIDNEKNLLIIKQTLEKISREYKKKIIFSLHPRTKNKLKKLIFKSFLKNKNIIFSKPFGFFDYVNLQKNSLCVISDSGTLSEESYLLNFPALSIRSSNERPEGMDSGVLVFTGLTTENICNSLKRLVNFRKIYMQKNLVADYEMTNVSEVAIKAIYSYIQIVNKKIWNKQ